MLTEMTEMRDDIEIKITNKVNGCLNGILWSYEPKKTRKFNIYKTVIKCSLQMRYMGITECIERKLKQ